MFEVRSYCCKINEKLGECYKKDVAICDSHSLMPVSSLRSWFPWPEINLVKPKNVTGRGRKFASQPKMKVRPSASCQKKQIFLSLCHKGEWDVLLSCRTAKNEGSQGCKDMHVLYACIEVTNCHFLNRELIPNEYCCNAIHNIWTEIPRHEYYMVRRGEMQWTFWCNVELEKKLWLESTLAIILWMFFFVFAWESFTPTAWQEIWSNIEK